MKEYDTELDQRLDIIYEYCISTCPPWEFLKNILRGSTTKKNEEEYECLVPDSDAQPPPPPVEPPTKNKTEKNEKNE